MVKKDAVVSITGKQEYVGGEPDQVELVTDGRFYCRDGSFYISYQESQLTGMEDTRTTVKVEKERVQIIRTGSSHCQLCFEKGQRRDTLYRTPYGPMSLSTVTHQLNVDMGEEGGTLEIRYGVEVGGTPASVNHLKINVRPCGQGEE